MDGRLIHSIQVKYPCFPLSSSMSKFKFICLLKSNIKLYRKYGFLFNKRLFIHTEHSNAYTQEKEIDLTLYEYYIDL